MSGDERRFLDEASGLAERGRHDVEPNPPVGCVLAKDGVVVGRGWHRAYGGPHAEVWALREAGERARGATAYVSLEPCRRTGKTPPCLDALVAAGVAEVVWESADPTQADVSPSTVEAFARAGVRARGPRLRVPLVRGPDWVLAAASRDRPWVVAKWAMSVDGRTAPAAGVGGRLAGDAEQTWVHDVRGRVEAVATGSGTVAVDDPLLTCRLPDGPPDGRPQPLRVVFDSRLSTASERAIVRSASPGAPVLLVHAGAPAPRRAALERPGLETLDVPGPAGHVDLGAALQALRARGVRRLLLEGGTRLTTAFLRAGLVDQVYALVTPVLLGGRGAPTATEDTGWTSIADAPRLTHVRPRILGDDVLVRGYLEGPPVSGASCS